MQGVAADRPQDVENSNLSEEVPDVTAAINVDDDIVRGTANVSVQQSVDSHPMEHQSSTVHGQGSTNSVIKVRHFISSEAGTKRVHGYGGNIVAGIEETTLNAEEHGTYQGYQSPQTMGIASEVMTENSQPHHLNTVPHPRTTNQLNEEEDFDSSTVRRAVVTRDDEGVEEVYRSNELPYDIFTQPPGTPPDTPEVQNQKNQQQRIQQAQTQRIFLSSEGAGSETCKEVLEQDEEDDEYSDDVDFQKSQARSAARTQAQQQQKEEVTHFEQQKVQEQEQEQEQEQLEVTRIDNNDTILSKKVKAPMLAMPDTAVLIELEKLVINLNHMAMAHLKTDQFQQAKRLLQRAEANLTQVDRQCIELKANTDSIGDLNDQALQQRLSDIYEVETLKNRLMGLTYNNFGCLCKQKKDFKGALDYLKRALNYESRLEDFSTMQELDSKDGPQDEKEAMEFAQDLKTTNCNSAGTILNICAILSKISKHAQAHEYAEEAVTKLKHSMRLTKGQASIATRRLDAIIERLQQARREGKNDDEIEAMENEVAQHEQLKIDLENQWINLATTAVIAHYNAAVELEFMSLWRESLLAYEKAARLASVAMKAQNPMSQKIAQAIFKMRMKVRNKVQLPDKRSHQQGDKASTTASVGGKKRSQRMDRSFFSNSKITSQMQGSVQQTNNMNLKDWQTSINSQRSNVQPDGRPSTNAVTNSAEQSTLQNHDLQPAMNLESFYPEESVESTQEVYLAQSAVNKRRQKIDLDRKANLTSNAATCKAINDKSPLSLKKIIDKLQKTEQLEAKQLQPKSKLRNAGRNFQTIQSYCGSTDDDGFSTFQLQQPYPTAGGSAVPCSRTQRLAMQTAGTQSIDPNFLPSLNQPRGKTSFFSTRNNAARYQTIQQLRQSISPQRENGVATVRRGNLMAPVGRRNKGRGGSLLPPTAPQADGGRAVGNLLSDNEADNLAYKSKIQSLQVLKDESTKRRLSRLGVGHLSPTRLQIQLSMVQERRLTEQGKRNFVQTSKRDQEINQMLGPLIAKPAQRANKKPRATGSIGPITADLTAMKVQSILTTTMTPTGANLACSAYLTKKLKNSIKQKHQAKHADSAITAQFRKASLNAKMETAFKKEMAAWKQAREIGTGARKMSPQLDQSSQERIGTDFAHVCQNHQHQQPNNYDLERHDQVVSAQCEVLSAIYFGSAEQAQEARSIRNDSPPKLTDKQGAQEIDAGPSRDVDEQEVGDCRPSPQSYCTRKAITGQQEMTFSKRRSTGAGGDRESDGDISPIQDYTTHKDESQNYSLANIVNGQQQDQNATCQEVLLDRGSFKASETIEVEDIVSADTNNGAAGGCTKTTRVGNRFQSYRTNSSAFHQTGEMAPIQRGQTPEPDIIARMNNDSGLKTAEDTCHQQNTARAQHIRCTTGTEILNGTAGKRSQNVKSSLAVTSGQKLETFVALGNPGDNNRGSVEVRGAADDHGVPVVGIDHEEYAQYRELHKVSQNQGSSIIDSQQTETIQTNQSECGRLDKQIDTLHDSTIHEDTIDAWKLQFASNTEVNPPSGTIVESQSPDLTDEIVTTGDKNSQIGDGPIYIKKSTDYHATTTRRIKYVGSQSSLEQTEFAVNTQNARKIGNNMLIRDSAVGLQHEVSCKVSDITQLTEMRPFKHDISQGQAIHVQAYNVDSARGPDQSSMTQPSPRENLMMNAGHRNSEIMTAEYPSRLSIDPAYQVADTVSQDTEPVNARCISHQIKGPAGVGSGGNQSGKIRVQDEQPRNVVATTADISSFMTPRPGLTSGLIMRETVADGSSRIRLERCSVDTEVVQTGMPKHIMLSKGNKRPQAGPQRQASLPKKTTFNGATTKFKIKPGQELLRRQKKEVPKAALGGPASEIPEAIHVSETGNHSMVHRMNSNITRPGGVTSDPLIGSDTQEQDTSKAQQNKEVAGITRHIKSINPASHNATEVARVQSHTLRNSSGIIQESVVQHQTPLAQTEKPIHTEDRVAKIAEQISKLNTNLLQFQSEIEESKKDPLLKSTHRSTASKKGLMSQKSREIGGAALSIVSRVSDLQSQTDVIHMPEHVAAMQDKRLAAQLQSAPGRSRVKM